MSVIQPARRHGALALALAGAVIASLPVPALAGPPATLEIEELGGARVDVDAGAPGPSAGDRSVFRSPVTVGDGDGGTVYGVTTTVRTAAELAPDGVAVTLLAYDLGAGSTMVLAGTGPGSEGGVPPVGTVVRRTILGGTGAFSGVRGELVSTVGTDGAWSNEMTLLGVGDPVTRTLTVKVPVPASRPSSGPATPVEPGDALTDRFPIVADGKAHLGYASITGVGDAIVTGDPMRVVLCLVAFDLGGADRIYLAGLTPVPAGEPGPRLPTMPLAIIGGTGRFEAARGEDVVTFAPSGSIHALRFVGGGAPEGSLGGGTEVALSTVANDPAEIELGGGDGSSLGDLWTWTSRTEEANAVDGSSVGLLTNVAIANDRVTRMGLAFYERAGGDLVVASLDDYPAPGAPMTVGTRRVRALVGGTGDTIGASGAVGIERVGDDRFDYLFVLGDTVHGTDPS